MTDPKGVEMAVAQEELEDQERSATHDLTLEVQSMLKAVGVAASTDEGRPVLCAVDLTLHADGRLEAVCTDSYILVHRQVSFLGKMGGKPKGEPIHVIVNAQDLKRAVSLAHRLQRGSPLTDSEITISTTGVTVEAPNVSMKVKAEMGEYPDWRKLSNLAKSEAVPGLLFNPVFMHRIGTALEAMDGLRADFAGGTGPMRLWSSHAKVGAPNWALQMPIRDPETR